MHRKAFLTIIGLEFPNWIIGNNLKDPLSVWLSRAT